ncbi:MAG TPA: hypothetical protein PK771_09220, partial [Spirochaetota bacterium]|nr:hypothetical protein [Spirochaetota bacterium]
YILDINNFWLESIEPEKNNNLKFNTIFIYSDYYDNNIKRIKESLRDINIIKEIKSERKSISEIILSKETIDFLNKESVSYFK